MTKTTQHKCFVVVLCVECYVVRKIRTEYFKCDHSLFRRIVEYVCVFEWHCAHTQRTNQLYTNTNDETKTKNNSAHFSIFVRNFYLWYHLSTITTEKGYLYTNSRIIIWIIPPTRKKNLFTTDVEVIHLFDACTDK